MKKSRIITISFSILILLALIVGFSYARINIKVNAEKTNLIEAGCLKVSLTDNGNLNLANSIPVSDAIGVDSDPYIFTITNECTLTAYYETTFNILNTSNSENLSKVKLNLTGDSYVAPTQISSLSSATMFETYNNISNSYLLDSGYLRAGDSKTFKLRMWIKEEVTEYSGALDTKIIVNSKAKEGPSYNTNTAGYTIIKNNQIITSKEGNPNFSYVSPYTDNNGIYTQTSGLFKEYENKYYYRGNVINNYIKFGKYKQNETINYTTSTGTSASITHTQNEDIVWRIVGINEDGSLRLVLNDLIGFAPIDQTYTTYASSSLKNTLNTWYETHLLDNEEYIVDSKFCQDITGTGTNPIYYGSYTRNITSTNPSTVCSGNNKYIEEDGYPINLLTIDEVAIAGWNYTTAVTNNYLNRNYNIWTMSPMSSSTDVTQYGSLINNKLSYSNTTTNLGIVPVINITADTIITGAGTSENKYQVIGLYSDANIIYTDNIAPTIIEAYATKEVSKTNKSIIITAKDNEEGTGISGYVIKQINQTPEISDYDWVSTTDETIKTNTIYANGTYYIWIKDNNGNISNVYTLVISDIDTTAPTCVINVTQASENTKTKTLTITTTSPDVSLIGYSWDNVNFGENMSKIITANGTYTAYVKDNAGNIGNCSVNITTITTD